jgi:small-conductance mechanosensitive channel/CRP-like cAMP-binding protein
MDVSTLSSPLVVSTLWLLLAGFLVLVWLVLRERPLPRRFGGALWCVVAAVVAEAVMPWLSGRPAGIAFVLTIAALSFAIVRGIAVTADLIVRRRRVHVSTIFRDLATVLVYVVVVLAVLHSVDVDVTALLTTSAILTAVVGLALQETLGNVFSGLSLQLQKPFEPGDWIRFQGHLGRVLGIGWRSTTLITRDLAHLDVPNGVLAREVVANYRGTAVGDELFLGVSYKTPPNVAKQAMLSVLHEVPDVVPMPPAVIELEEYGDSSIKYRVRFWMLDYGRQEQVRDQIMTAIWYALRRAEIQIPFPIRDVFVHTDSDAHADGGAVERQRLSALRQVDFLAELADAELEVLRSNLAEAVFGHGEIICREGDPGDTFFVLRRGHVEVTARGVGGYETHVADLAAPAFFGEMALLTGEPRSATVRAKGDTELLILERAGFEELFKTRPSVAAAVSRVLAMRQSELRERREQSVVPESTESRSRRLLAKMQAIFRF